MSSLLKLHDNDIKIIINIIDTLKLEKNKIYSNFVFYNICNTFSDINKIELNINKFFFQLDSSKIILIDNPNIYSFKII